MRTLRTLVLLGGMLAASELAMAQTSTLKFQSTPPSPRVTAYGYYVGPFTATVLSDPTLPTISIFCVDILNTISWGQQWIVNRTSLASSDLSNTRRGSGMLDQYRQAAWLASQFSLTATTQWAGIQAAIWQVLNPGSPNGGTAESYWLNQANTFASTAAYATFNWNQVQVLTPTTAAGRKHGGPQEFITFVAATPAVTPEPATWLLLGTGLAGVFGIVALRARV